PGRGNNVAFGHCKVNLVTGIGVCELKGGTGQFKRLRARVDVTPCTESTCSSAPAGHPEGYFAWDGTYSYSN
ncbi:MAG: hypothetical protein ACRENK_03380, partial [Gemmatimonadaceae bacterium]